MLSKTALKHFNDIWKLFDSKMFSMRGYIFTIEPIEHFLTNQYANTLTEKEAKEGLHKNLIKWGQIEQSDHEIEVIEEYELPDGKKLQRTQFKDPDVRWARKFVFLAFYNLCSLAANKKTIEELILLAMRDRTKPERDRKTITSYHRLLGINNAFLTAEWARDIILEAVANDNKSFFNSFNKWLVKDSLQEQFDIARTWLGAIMLWYLGGVEMPRREFIILLKQQKLISESLDELSFNAEINKLHLIKGLDITK